MGSFLIEEFVGNGALKELVPKLLEEGWDDVPTLKIMNVEDMDALNFTQQQKDALELRSYLHDRSLLQYGDKLEASRKCLPDLLSLDTLLLWSQFGMKRGHIVRFLSKTPAWGDPIPSVYALHSRKRIIVHSSTDSISINELESVNSKQMQSTMRSSVKSSVGYDRSFEQSLGEIKIKDGHVFKGIVASAPADASLCRCVQPPPVVNDIAPYSAIENISVQKLAPEYKIGMERLVKTKTPPMKASELWRHKPVVLLCIRRPGCIMCRAEAHQLYARKPIFDALGFQLIAVLHEEIESEVKDFWPRYWGGVVVVDRGRDFFKALGGGKLLKDKFITGFLFNPQAISNYKRAMSMGMKRTLKGEGEIKGGLFIVGEGKTGIAYQFVERNFGDWAPVGEVIEICSRLQNQQQGQEESIATSQEPK